MHNLFKALLSICFSGLLAANAAAQTPTFYVGVHGGLSMADTELSGGGFSFDGIGSKGWIGGVQGGLDLNLPNGGAPPQFFVGGYGSYSWQNTDTELKTGGPNWTGSLGDSWSVGGRAGTYYGASKIYVLAGWRQTELDLGALAPSMTLQGWDVGLGAAIPITDFMEFGIEAVRTQYQDEKIGPINLSSEQLSVLARLNFKLGGPGKSSIFTNEDDNKAVGCDPKLRGCK